jgi:hypothetical protein
VIRWRIGDFGLAQGLSAIRNPGIHNPYNSFPIFAHHFDGKPLQRPCLSADRESAGRGHTMKNSFSEQ